MAKKKASESVLNDYFSWVKSVWVNSRGEPLDFKDHRYLDEIYTDQHPNLVFMKAAQMGLSERLISEAVFVCDRLNKNCLYTFPTSSQLSDFVQARLEPVFNFSEYLSHITGTLSAEERKEKNLDSRKKVAKVGLKQVRNAFIYLRGSQNEQQIISVDADMVVLDERDRFTDKHVPYIDKRLLHSTLKWRREASTPTFPGFGVHESFLNSDQRVWMLKCRNCKLEQEIDFFENIDAKKKTVICKKCKGKINRLKKGRWVPQKPENSEEIHGYKISGLHNPRRTIAEILEQYEKAKTKGPAAMQQFYNQVLGMPYEVEGQKVLLTDLNNVCGDYEMPYDAEGCYAGADVGTKIHVIVSQNIDKKNRYVWIGTVTNFLGPADSLEALIKKFGIRCLVVDAKPDTREVGKLIDAYPDIVYAAYYPTRKFDVQNYYIYDDIKHEVYVDRTISLDYLVSDIHNEVIELPRNAKYISEFYNQMTSSMRITKPDGRTGQLTARWVERGPDHFFHTANYNRIAVSRGGVGQALLDSYKKINEETDKKENHPDSIWGIAKWVKLKGERIF